MLLSRVQPVRSHCANVINLRLKPVSAQRSLTSNLTRSKDIHGFIGTFPSRKLFISNSIAHIKPFRNIRPFSEESGESKDTNKNVTEGDLFGVKTSGITALDEDSRSLSRLTPTQQKLVWEAKMQLELLEHHNERKLFADLAKNHNRILSSQLVKLGLDKNTLSHQTKKQFAEVNFDGSEPNSAASKEIFGEHPTSKRQGLFLSLNHRELELVNQFQSAINNPSQLVSLYTSNRPTMLVSIRKKEILSGLIFASAEANDIKAVKFFWSEYPDRNSSDDYNAIVYATAATGSINDLKEIFSELKNRNLQITQDTIVAAYQGALKDFQKLVEVSSFIEALDSEQPSEHVFSLVMESLEGSDLNWKSIHELYLKTNSNLLRNLLRYHGKHNLPESKGPLADALELKSLADSQDWESLESKCNRLRDNGFSNWGPISYKSILSLVDGPTTSFSAALNTWEDNKGRLQLDVLPGNLRIFYGLLRMNNYNRAHYIWQHSIKHFVKDTLLTNIAYLRLLKAQGRILEGSEVEKALMSAFPFNPPKSFFSYDDVAIDVQSFSNHHEYRLVPLTSGTQLLNLTEEALIKQLLSVRTKLEKFRAENQVIVDNAVNSGKVISDINSSESMRQQVLFLNWLNPRISYIDDILTKPDVQREHIELLNTQGLQVLMEKVFAAPEDTIKRDYFPIGEIQRDLWKDLPPVGWARENRRRQFSSPANQDQEQGSREDQKKQKRQGFQRKTAGGRGGQQQGQGQGRFQRQQNPRQGSKQ